MVIAAVCAMRMTVYREHRLLGQGTGETGFPQSPTRGRVWAGVARAQGTGETRFPPFPHPVGGWGRVQPVRRGLGKPGFPTPPPGGRVGAGYALKQGYIVADQVRTPIKTLLTTSTSSAPSEASGVQRPRPRRGLRPPTAMCASPAARIPMVGCRMKGRLK